MVVTVIDGVGINVLVTNLYLEILKNIRRACAGNSVERTQMRVDFCVPFLLSFPVPSLEIVGMIIIRFM
jgi:hypothetical protein